MIVRDDVEMKGREKEWFWSELVSDEFEALTKVANLKKIMNSMNT